MSLLDNLISSYSFENDATDDHGSNDLTEQGSFGYTTGKVGNCGDLNGSTDYCSINGNPFSASQGAISFWFNANDVSGYEVFFSCGDNSASESDPPYFFLMRYGNGSKINFNISFRSSAGGTVDSISTAFSYNSGTWYHVVLNTNGNTWTLYINGAAVSLSVNEGSNSGGWFGDLSFPGTVKTDIGAQWYANATSRYFNGLLDQFAVFDQPLTTDEISELYNNGNGISYGRMGAVDGAISESAIASSAINDNIGIVNESAEVSSALADNIDINSESATVSDDITAIKNKSGSISESADASDVIAGQVGSIGSTSNSADASDQVLVTKYTYPGMSESVVLSDAFIAGSKKYLSLSENLTIWDYPASSWIRTIAESINASDGVSLHLILKINEYVALKEALISKWDGVEIVVEEIFIRDIITLIQALEPIIYESLIATDNTTVLTGLLIKEYLSAKEIVNMIGVFNRSISETITSIDNAVSSWVFNILENITSTDSVNLLLKVLLSEGIIISDVLAETGVFYKGLAETITVADAVSKGFNLDISENVNAVDLSTVMTTFYNTVSESLVSVDTIVGTNTIVITTNETITIIDTIGNGVSLYIGVTDGVSLGVTISIDNDIYECFVLNTTNFFPSVYSGFDFNSYCVYDNRAFGANATGIFELTGSTDNGSVIHSGTIFHETDFEIPNKKRFRKAYLSVDGDTPIMVMELSDGTRQAYYINDKGIVDASRDVQGRHWTLSIADFDELSLIKLIPVILSKGR